ncbi:MAG: ABC-2 family transporter protein [Eubacterium sp.]|nr:ABC-2 family transporter protein [Eubacterium sp.]
MSVVKLYLKFIRIFIKSKIEYRFGLMFELIANMVLIGIYFLSIYVIFFNFTNVHGWNQYEFVFMFTTSWISYSLSSYLFWKPMQDMGNMITSGEFDSYLIRPISPLKYLVFRQFQYTFLPRMVLAIGFWVYSLAHVSVNWNIWKILYLIVTLIMGFLIYTSIFVILGALSFWILKSYDVTAIIINNDYGIRTYADYPLDIYGKGIKLLLTFILPFAFTGYYTISYILEKNMDSVLLRLSPVIAPIVTAIYVMFAYKMWCTGIKRYSSAGN